jgi:stage II sporulation protein E
VGKWRLQLEQEQPARIVGWGIRFFLAAALSAAVMPGGNAPFALGLVAAAGGGAESAAALLGAGVGAVLFLDFADGLAQLAAAILICTVYGAVGGLGLAKRPAFPALLAAGMFLAVRMAYVLQALDPLSRLFPCLTSAVLAGASAWQYAPLLAPGREERRETAALAVAVTVLTALESLQAGEVSLGRAALVSVLLTAAWRQGSAVGAAAGLLGGFLADLRGGEGTLFFTAAYGLLGVLAGTRRGRSRLSAAGWGLAAVGLVLLPLDDQRGGPLLWETLLGLPVFLFFPLKALGGKRLRREDGGGPTLSETLRDRLNRTAAALRDLYDSVGRSLPAPGEENPAAIFDRTAERVCRECALCALCWKQEYVATFNALNDATPFLLERGRALPKDFPRHFTDRCIRLPEFLTAVNGELTAFLLRRQYRREVQETRRSARGQYAQLSELLSAAAAGLGAAPAGAAARPYRIGAALRPRAGESVCGDSVSAFETEGGLLCLLVCDGSGSGEGARRESALTERLVRQFLEAGVAPEAALRTVNDALALRSAESGSFSTVDLLAVELSGGDAALYKYGAAPSYLKKCGSVSRITGGALPAGLRTAPAPPDVTRFPLPEGAFFVLVSDGVADALQDEWLQNFLAGWDGTDPQALANLLLQEAARQGRTDDDCAVQVLCLPAEGRPRRV